MTLKEAQEITRKLRQDGYVERNIEKLSKFRAYCLWYMDLFLDMITPQEGGIHLHLDQRIFIRAATRFLSFHGCFPRGYGKTFDEVLVAFVTAMIFPDIDISMSAQTKENAASILSDKYSEIIRFYPILENEVKYTSFSRNQAKIILKNGSTIDCIANAQTSKGQRRKRLSIEESNLMNNEVFQDALRPVVEVGRRTRGRLSLVNPYEANGQIGYYTTPGWRGSDDHQRVCQMIQDMTDLKGQIVLGSDWRLPCWYDRGSTKSQILELMKTMNPTAFLQNYGGQWTGSTTGALVSINKLLKCRTLTEPLFSSKDDEIYVGVDVARSQQESNNKSSISIVCVKRNERGRVISLDLVNIFNISNTLNYANQALIVKRAKKQYNARMVVVDGNGLGAGLVDELLKDTIDPMTGESLGCWDTINTTNEPEDPQNCEAVLFDMKAQSYQTKVLTDFIDVVDNGTLRLLESKQYDVFAAEHDESYQDKFMPFIQTDLFVEEVANLKLESNGKTLSIKKEVSRIDKDRFSSVSYAVFYILEFENTTQQVNTNWDDMTFFRAPVTKK